MRRQSLPKNPRHCRTDHQQADDQAADLRVIDQVTRHCGQKETVIFSATRIIALGFYNAFKACIRSGKDDNGRAALQWKIVRGHPYLAKDFESITNDGLITPCARSTTRSSDAGRRRLENRQVDDEDISSTKKTASGAGCDIKLDLHDGASVRVFRRPRFASSPHARAGWPSVGRDHRTARRSSRTSRKASRARVLPLDPRRP